MTLKDLVLPFDAIYLRKYPHWGTRGHFPLLSPLLFPCASPALFLRLHCCSHPYSFPAPRLRSSFACTVALNYFSKPVFRINLIAAVAPCFVPRTSFRSLAISFNSFSLSLSHCGQDRRTCRTLIAVYPHAQRSFQILGTFLSYKNSLKPILSIYSWVSNALYAFALPACNVRFFSSGSSAILRRCYLFISRFHFSFYFLSASSSIAFYASCI
jgi:hypothetical protein